MEEEQHKKHREAGYKKLEEWHEERRKRQRAREEQQLPPQEDKEEPPTPVPFKAKVPPPGCDALRPDSDLNLPVHLAAAMGHNKVVSKLLAEQAWYSKGAHLQQMRAVNRQQQSPLHLAAASGSVATVETVLKQAQVLEDEERSRKQELVPVASIKDQGGHTALHLAALSWPSIVTALREHGCEVQAGNSKGQHAAHLAAMAGRVDILEALKSRVQSSRYPTSGSTASFEARDAAGCTPLHVAARFGRLAAVQWLLSQDWGERSLVLACDTGGWTALHLACEAGHAEVAGALLQHRDTAQSQLSMRTRHAAKDLTSSGSMRGALTATAFELLPVQLATRQGHADVLQV
jgi:ankyrin repeat protein